MPNKKSKGKGWRSGDWNMFRRVHGHVTNIVGYDKETWVQSHGDNEELLKAKFFLTRDAELAKSIFEQHFGLRLDGDPPWELGPLRKAWKTLERLPKEDAARVKTLEKVNDKPASGEYIHRDYGVLAQRVEVSSKVLTSLKAKSPDRAAPPGKPLHGFNQFDHVFTHEVGHAVDHPLDRTHHLIDDPSYSDRFNPAGWSKHTTADAIGAFVSWHERNETDATRASMLRFLRDAFNGPDGMVIPATEPAGWRSRVNDYASHTEHLTGAELNIWVTHVTALTKSLLAARNNPWQDADGGAGKGCQCDTRIYTSPDGKNWFSYSADDRPYMVSNYQYRAPGEWFAEHYVAYQNPVTREWLRQNDPYTHDFFDFIVAGGLPAPPPLRGRPAHYVPQPGIHGFLRGG